MNRIKRFTIGTVTRFVASAALVVLSTSASAQLPSAQLTSIFPPGGKQGTSADVTIAGNDLDEVQSLLFSHPGLSAQPKTRSATSLEPSRTIPNEFTVAITPETPAGIYEVRAFGRFGLSNPRSFAVGTSDEKRETGGNTSPDKAVDLPLGTTLSGRVEPTTFEYIRLDLRKDEPVLLEVTARRIDSRLDGTLTILDPSGRQLKRVKQGAGADPVVVFTPPADGRYLLKLSDEVYGGGNDYFYRLTASRAPFVDFVFPPSGVPGKAATHTIYGRNLPGGKPAGNLTIHGYPLEKIETEITLPDDEQAVARLPLTGSWPLARAWQDGIEYRLPSAGGAANPVSIYFAKAPSVVPEVEPNDKPQQSQRVTLPCEVVGQFYPERDFDWIEFDAKKGQTWWIEAISNQMGLASDPAIIIYRLTATDKAEPQQTEIAQIDDMPDRGRRNPATDEFDATSDDPAYKFVVPEDGSYRLLVRDQFGDGRKDPSFVYRLVIRQPDPDFRVLAYSAAPPPTQQMAVQTPLAAATVRRGGTAAFNVLVQRRDEFDGEIRVDVEGLPSGVTSAGAVVGGDVSTAAIVLVAAEDAQAFAGPIKITARATLAGREVVREARYAVVVWGTANRQQQPAEFRLAPGLQLGVLDKEADPALVRIGEDKVYETAIGGNVEIPVEVKRRGDYKDPIKLVAVGLTQQMRPKDITLAGDASQAKFELALNQQNIRPGSYTFYMKGESKRRYTRNPEAVSACEEEQKRLAEMIKAIQDEIKSATDAKNEAAVQAAQVKLKEATDLKDQCAKRLDDAKKTSQPKDVNIALISTPIKLRIHASPIKLEPVTSDVKLKREASQSIPVKIERLYGFADQVELTLEPPQGVSGLSAQKATLKKDESEAKMELSAADKAPPGKHECTLRARGRFNNVQVETTTLITVIIEAP